jgi:hypothetical protein
LEDSQEHIGTQEVVDLEDTGYNAGAEADNEDDDDTSDRSARSPDPPFMDDDEPFAPEEPSGNGGASVAEPGPQKGNAQGGGLSPNGSQVENEETSADKDLSKGGGDGRPQAIPQQHSNSSPSQTNGGSSSVDGNVNRRDPINESLQNHEQFQGSQQLPRMMPGAQPHPQILPGIPEAHHSVATNPASGEYSVLNDLGFWHTILRHNPVMLDGPGLGPGMLSTMFSHFEWLRDPTMAGGTSKKKINCTAFDVIFKIVLFFYRITSASNANTSGWNCDFRATRV